MNPTEVEEIVALAEAAAAKLTQKALAAPLANRIFKLVNSVITSIEAPPPAVPAPLTGE